MAGRDFGVPGGAQNFLVRRGIRILPMYWLYTFTYLLVMLEQTAWSAQAGSGAVSVIYDAG